MSGTAGELWIVGAGRAGLALGLLLSRARAFSELLCVGRRPHPPDHPLFAGSAPRARYASRLQAPAAPLAGVLLAVPDAAVPELAAALAALPLPVGTPVLHLSGARGAEVLQPLSEIGCSTGALHPLASLADPVEGAERLRRASWGLEAAGAARDFAEQVVAAADGRILEVRPGSRAIYHAAAVFASNYLVALLGVAERVMAAAGVPAAAARTAVGSLAAGTLANVTRQGPVAALTGPVARGDVDTIRSHLASLSEAERGLYCSLVRPTLALAREAGLSDADAERITRVLEGER